MPAKRRQQPATGAANAAKSAQNSPAPKYDVAISFLSRDEAVALALHARLSESLRVFFYPRNQEDLAGTDGLDSMQRPFRDECRIAVVLFRELWGQTPWTRVEETAIKDRCLNKGWETLFFITLDKSSKLPKWLPPTHVRLSYEDFGLEQAVGAIKARVQERGGEIRQPDALTKARLVQEEAQFLADRTSLLRNFVWIRDTVRPAVSDIFGEVVRLCGETARTTGMQIFAEADVNRCVMTDGRVSAVVGWKQEYANDISRESYLIMTEYRGRLILPSERRMYIFGEPPKLHERRLKVEVSRTRELRWVEVTKPHELLTNTEVADYSVRVFLDLIRKVNRGEVNLQEHP